MIKIYTPIYVNTHITLYRRKVLRIEQQKTAKIPACHSYSDMLHMCDGCQGVCVCDLVTQPLMQASLMRQTAQHGCSY